MKKWLKSVAAALAFAGLAWATGPFTAQAAQQPLPEGWNDFASPFLHMHVPSSNSKFDIAGVWITHDGRTWAMVKCNYDEFVKNYTVDISVPAQASPFVRLYAGNFQRWPTLAPLTEGLLDVDGRRTGLPDTEGGKAVYYYPVDVTSRVVFGENFETKLDCLEVGNGHDTKGLCSLVLDGYALITVMCHYGEGADERIAVEKAEVTIEPVPGIERPACSYEPTEGIWILTAGAIGRKPVPIVDGGVKISPEKGTVTLCDFYYKEGLPVTVRYVSVDETGARTGELDSLSTNIVIGTEVSCTEFIRNIEGYHLQKTSDPIVVSRGGQNELVLSYRLPDNDIPPRIADGPDGSGFGDDPHDAIHNDETHPWEVVPDPKDPDGTNTVAQSYDWLVPGGSCDITITVVGPGVLTWDDLVADAVKGGSPATLAVTVDGGDAITLHAGDMSAWAHENIVFGGEMDQTHVVKITFTNNTAPDATEVAHGYVDHVVWKPYSNDIAAPVADPRAGQDAWHPALDVTNLGTDPAAERKGDTTLNGRDLVTTSTLDANGKQTGAVANTTATAATTGTEDYWYVATDPADANHPGYARTAPTLSAGEATTFTVTDLPGPGKLSWDMAIDPGAGADATPARLDVVVTKRLVDADGAVTNTTTATYTYTADEIASWTDGYLPFGGPANARYDVAFTFTNDSDGDALCRVDNILWTIPDIDIPHTQNDDPNKPSTRGDKYPNEPGQPGNPGYKVVNDPEDPWEVTPDPKANTPGANPSADRDNLVATTPDSVPPAGTATIRYEVENDGEFRWDSLIQPGTGTTPASVAVVVDGVTNFVYVAADDDPTTTDDGTGWTSHVIHVEGDTEPGHPHVIELVFTNDDGDGASKVSIDDASWEQAVSDEWMKENLVRVSMPDTIAWEDPRRVVKVDNDDPSGWLSGSYFYGDEHTGYGVRTANGSEVEKTLPDGTVVHELESTITVKVLGTGELKIGEIISESDNGGALADATDGGRITIRVDGKEYPLDPGDDPKDIRDAIITVSGGGNVEHVVEIVYTRTSGDTTKNSSCEVFDILWRAFDEADGGGSSWLKDEGVALWIVDHEERDDGRCYLAFEPQLKVKAEFREWLRRTRDNRHVFVKYGRTWQECDACEPVEAFAREHRKETGIFHADCDDGERDADKGWMWIQVDLPKTTVLPLGYWRVYIAEAPIAFTNGGTFKVVYVDDATGEPLPGVKPRGPYSLPAGTQVDPRGYMYVDTPGYDLVYERNPYPAVIETDKELTFAYRFKRVYYKVNYLEVGTDRVLAPQKVVSDGVHQLGETVTEHAVGVDGYELTGPDTQDLTLGDPKTSYNEITFYYRKLPVPTVWTYTVQYICADTGELLAPEETRTVDRSVTSVTEYAKEFAGHKLWEGVSAPAVYTFEPQDGGLVTFLYRIVTSYSVYYREKGTNKMLAEPKVVTDQPVAWVDTVTEQALDIAGYRLADDATKTLKLEYYADRNVITFYYEAIPEQKMVSYTVRYLDMYSQMLILPDVIREVKAGEIVTERAPEIVGFTLLNDSEIKTRIQGDEVLVFVYGEEGVLD